MGNKDRFGLKGNTIAGTFRVDDVVAEGGFGIVYRAFHLAFRSPVALKCLKIPGELSEKERQEFLEQFRSEAEIQFRLSAALPNIARPLHVDAVHNDEGLFIPIMALEWLEGQSFEKIIEHRTFSNQDPMPLDEAMDLIGPAAQALHEAHHFTVNGEELTVVHRDIKPDNLFVTDIGGKKVVKLLDFGISKVRRAATQLAGHFSQTSGSAPFSPAYGAPEQWVPKRFGQTGPWTDVWGLALTLVEIIKGDAVIVGDHQAMMGTCLDPKVRPSPRSEGVAVSDEVESVFLKALSLDPRYRYQSVKDFWESLGAAMVMSADGGPLYDETPSGRRIPLPPMSAPTPWTPPNKALLEDPTPIGQLPPMMAPAMMERTNTDDAQVEPGERASMPLDPNSDLQPVPPAPTPQESEYDLDIPPMTADFDEVAESSRRGADQKRSRSEPRAKLVSDEPTPEREPSIKLELAPTSAYPAPPAAAAEFKARAAAHQESASASPAPVSQAVKDAPRVPPPVEASAPMPEIPPLELEPTQPRASRRAQPASSSVSNSARSTPGSHVPSSHEREVQPGRRPPPPSRQSRSKPPPPPRRGAPSRKAPQQPPMAQRAPAAQRSPAAATSLAQGTPPPTKRSQAAAPPPTTRSSQGAQAPQDAHRPSVPQRPAPPRPRKARRSTGS